MLLRSRKGEAREGQHLQIRSLWPAATVSCKTSASRPGLPLPAVAQAYSSARQHERSAFSYLPGKPSPRASSQQWEAQFRLKLIAAIERRKRRAHLSIILGGSGVLLVASFFATLIFLHNPLGDRLGDRREAETAEAAIVPATPDRSLVAMPVTAQVADARNSGAVAHRTKFAALELSGGDLGGPTPIAALEGPERTGNSLAMSGVYPVASGNGLHATRTRFRFVGDMMSEPGAMILARGFPEGLSLSEGMSPTPGTWVLSLENTQDLSLIAPDHFRGTFRAQFEIIAAGGVSLGQQEIEINIPASAIVVAISRTKNSHRPRVLPSKAEPQQHARMPPDGKRLPVNGDRPASTTQQPLVTEALAAPQVVADDMAAQTTAKLAAPSQRRAFQPPTYGLGGPR